MVQILCYISLWLAVGGVIGCIGTFAVHAIGRAIGRLDARILILKGKFDIDKVDVDIARVEKDFEENFWEWVLWYAEIIITWPKSLFIFGEQLVKDIKIYAELKKKLKSMES